MNTVTRAKAALLSNFKGEVDNLGYTPSSQANLVPDVALDSIESDLLRGDGDELKTKFRAVHSSAALAVNSFGRFKQRPEDLFLLGAKGTRCIEFEKALRIFRGGRAPNLDVWIDRDDGQVGVESKLLEYLAPKRPAFSAAYERLAPPRCEPCWWDQYQAARKGSALHLDRAQLLKHYFGLNEYRRRAPSAKVTLLYIFWEPVNWPEVEECVRHRAEIESFGATLGGSQIPFRWMTYNELWDQWAAMPALAGHSGNLKARYQVRL